MLRTLAPAALLLAAACGADAPQPDGNQAAPAGEQAEAPPPRAEQAAPADAAGLREGKVGPISFRYDPAVLTAAEADVPLPPDWAAEVAATKLIPTERAALIGKAECLYGESGEAALCNPGQEAGLAFAMVDQRYDALAARLTDPAPQPLTLAGREGITWKIGAEGEGAEYMLLPAGDRTLLIVRQFRATADADPASIDAALNSLAFEGAAG